MPGPKKLASMRRRSDSRRGDDKEEAEEAREYADAAAEQAHGAECEHKQADADALDTVGARPQISAFTAVGPVSGQSLARVANRSRRASARV